MVVNMTIQNADNALLSALKSVCKLQPAANVSIKKQNSLADELKAEQAEVLEEYEKGTLKTFSAMDTSMRLLIVYRIATTKRFDKSLNEFVLYFQKEE